MCDKIKMEITINRTLSLDFDSVTNLDKLSDDTKINKSKLVRLFINYFSKNKDRLEELIKEGVK